MTALPRVIATDLDGTLLRSDRTVSTRTLGVLRELDEAGVRVVFVTARPPRWLPDVADAAGTHGTAVVLNGAAVYTFATGEISQVHGFAPGLLAELVADLRREIPGIAVALECVNGPVFDAAFAKAYPEKGLAAPAGGFPVHAELWFSAVVGKLLALHDGVDHDELYRRVAHVVGERAVLAFSGAVGLAEISPPGVTKAAGLARWCAEHGVRPEQVWAFGDMPNDVPMLNWAGRGIAVANAHADVLATCDDTTVSHDDDGVARYLERLLRVL